MYFLAMLLNVRIIWANDDAWISLLTLVTTRSPSPKYNKTGPMFSYICDLHFMEHCHITTYCRIPWPYMCSCYLGFYWIHLSLSHTFSYILSFWLSFLSSPSLSFSTLFFSWGEEGNLCIKGNGNGIASEHRVVDNNPCVICWVGLIMRCSWTNEEWEEKQQELKCMNEKNELDIKGGQQFGFIQDTPDSDYRAVRWLITWLGLVVGSGGAWADNEGFTT